MDNQEIIYYDSHIKAHQRYFLISLLEGAKSEKIKKLRELDLIPKKKYPTPKVSITETKLLSDTVLSEADLRSRFCSIKTGDQIKLTERVRRPELKIDIGIKELPLFGGRLSFVPLKEAAVDKQELSRRFEGITVNIGIPEKNANAPLDIRSDISERFRDIHLTNVDVDRNRSRISFTDGADIRKKFSGLRLGKIDMTDMVVKLDSKKITKEIKKDTALRSFALPHFATPTIAEIDSYELADSIISDKFKGFTSVPKVTDSFDVKSVPSFNKAVVRKRLGNIHAALSVGLPEQINIKPESRGELMKRIGDIGLPDIAVKPDKISFKPVMPQTDSVSRKISFISVPRTDKPVSVRSAFSTDKIAATVGSIKAPFYKAVRTDSEPLLKKQLRAVEKNAKVNTTVGIKPVKTVGAKIADVHMPRPVTVPLTDRISVKADRIFLDVPHAKLPDLSDIFDMLSAENGNAE